ncbi:endonuclease NucS [Shinella sp. CPCC 101442]|uniref:endonuclease NucS domain-containing protein n=1 Tax=Shinella sp. CPCC 101442 TaxID=2932265 RepID=UPI0021523AED|nr:endonuclease NucS domain-containing protein [Shinella sp. CPCC 101442]MCR6499291.1 endonuclease NucS [Shinella sp. CPCC 101442]
MRSDYKDWLLAQEYGENTRAAQLHRVAKVEQSYGSLDDCWTNGGFDALIADLTYSSADERAGKPNLSKIQFDGNIRNNLQSYKNAVVRYGKFLSDGPALNIAATSPPADVLNAALVDQKQKLSLERDMQAALRREITKLEPGLTILDDGAERAVTSGFIDIFCRDAEGRSVVVELKAGKTDARVVGQILGYIGDIMDEDGTTQVRGIVVASDFDQRTISAARAVPNLTLVRYAVSFTFEELA